MEPSKSSRVQAAESNGIQCGGRPALHSSRIFDDIARALSSNLPRRKAVSLALKGLASAALAEFGIKSGWAAVTCHCQGQSYDPVTYCCTPTGVQLKHPLTSTRFCPNRVAYPGYIPDPNAQCGNTGTFMARRVPNGYGPVSFLQCCKDHDYCYDKCNSLKSTCDTALRECILAACKRTFTSIFDRLQLAECAFAADKYYDGVTGAESDVAFEAAQDLGCDCCGDKGCSCTIGADCGNTLGCNTCLRRQENGQGVCVTNAQIIRCYLPCASDADCQSDEVCIKAGDAGCGINLNAGVCMKFC